MSVVSSSFHRSRINTGTIFRWRPLSPLFSSLPFTSPSNRQLSLILSHYIYTNILHDTYRYIQLGVCVNVLIYIHMEYVDTCVTEKNNGNLLLRFFSKNQLCMQW